LTQQRNNGHVQRLKKPQKDTQMTAPGSSLDIVQISKDPKSPTLAGWLSFFCCGAGQLYNGDTEKGIVLFAIALTPGLLFGPGAFVFSVPLVVYAIANAVNRAETINRANKTFLADQAQTLVADRNHKVSTVAAEDFVQAIYKAHQLFKSELLSQEEFSERKATTIDALSVKKPRGGVDEFLMELIPLIKSGALTMDEAKTIKGYVL
jgi:TM2 domain-containing membrane protein YozV